MKATEIRNILSIYDDDELNAACIAEMNEDLQDEIVKRICVAHGVSKLYGSILKFEIIKQVLENLNFKYVLADEKDESHFFFNQENGTSIDIYPTVFYEKQGTMHMRNFILV